MPLIATLLLIALNGTSLAGRVEGTFAVLQDDEAKRIDDLLKQLGADEFSVREKATEELKKIGKPAEEALKKAAEKSDDPEVRERARAVLESLSPKPGAQAPRRGAPGLPGLRGFNGSSVTVQTINGDSTYRIAPGDGSPGITFHKDRGGAVKLEYLDGKESKSAEAESVEKFLKDHPDLAAKYGISEDGIDYGGTKVRFKGGFPAMPVPMPRGFRVPKPLLDEEEDRESFRAGGATFEKPSEPLRAQLDLPAGEGLVVTRVDPGGAAESAGLRKSDVLVEIDGKKVTSAEVVRENLKGSKSAAVLRKGKRETLTPSVPKKDF